MLGSFFLKVASRASDSQKLVALMVSGRLLISVPASDISNVTVICEATNLQPSPDYELYKEIFKDVVWVFLFIALKFEHALNFEGSIIRQTTLNQPSNIIEALCSKLRQGF